jgi:aspartyl protease family protein
MKAVWTLFVVAGAGVLFAGRMPESGPAHGSQAVRPSHVNPWMKDSVARERQGDWNISEVSLPRSGDGHFYADVTINGVPTHMLVDTGASVIALTGSDARAMGLTWSEDQVTAVGQGAGGEVKGVEVTLDRVQLGNREVQSVPAVVLPDGLGVSLLGQSFLERVGRVEISGNTMVLGEKP